MAQKTGRGLVETSSMLENSERLEALPETTDALRRGERSASQLKDIASTAAESPSAERELLEAARRHSLKGLKDECRRVKARAMSETEARARARYEQIRKNRSLHMWTDQDGVGRVDARLTPDDFARLASAVRTQSNAIFNEARQAGHREPTAAYDADALVALVTGTGITGTHASDSAVSTRWLTAGRSDPGRPATVMHLRVDLAALRRGNLDAGENCEIPGVGPVPLASPLNVFGDAILKVIITNAVDVTTICHVGRAVMGIFPPRSGIAPSISRVTMVRRRRV
jgi:hypothetical protein